MFQHSPANLTLTGPTHDHFTFLKYLNALQPTVYLFNQLCRSHFLFSSIPYCISPTMRSFISLLAFPASSLAGSVLWSGIFDSSATVEDFDKCIQLPVLSNLNSH